MGLQYEELRVDGKEEYLRDQRPVIIVRNVCEVCGLSSFDSQYSFYRHLKYHYEGDPITGTYQERVPEAIQNVQQRDLDGGAGVASGDDTEGFVNDNEQFEEIFANNINKSPDMIEHLEIFIKNQENRTESYDRFTVIDDGMMMIEDSNSAEALAISETVQRVVELVDQEDAEMLPEATIGPLMVSGQNNPLDLPGNIEIIDDMAPMTHLNLRKIQIIEEEIVVEQAELLKEGPQSEVMTTHEIVIEEHPESPPIIVDDTVFVVVTNDSSSDCVKTKASNKSKKKQFPCPDCDRKFDSRSALKYHSSASHSSDRQFQCTYCDKPFHNKSTLNVHLRIHLEKRPYSCSKCDLSFRQKTDLNHHIESIHTSADNYRYQCDVCQKKFARQYSLNLHSKLHSGEKKHKCEFCEMSFRASSYLKVHRRKHTKEKPYACETCTRPFAIKADLRRHIRQIHEKDNGGGKWKTKVVKKTKET